jgi:hypothetical protein
LAILRRPPEQEALAAVPPVADEIKHRLEKAPLGMYLYETGSYRPVKRRRALPVSVTVTAS